MKEAAASIARNTAAMMGSQVVTWVSSFVLMMFLPRYLGDEAYGRLYFALSVSTLMALVMDLGIGNYIVKEVARDRTQVNRLLVNGAALKVVAWVGSLVLALTLVGLSGYQQETFTIVVILGLATILAGLSELTHRIFQGFERLQYRSFAIVVEKVFLSATGVTMLLLGFGATTIAIVMVLGTFLNLLTTLILLPKVVHVSVKLTPSVWPSLLRGGLPFLLSFTFSFVYYRVDVLMLSAMTSDRVVGWYGAPYKLFDTLMFFPVILQMAVYPVLARLWQSSRDSLVQTARKVMDITLIVGVPVAVLLFASAKTIVSMLFGLEHYANSVILLQVLSVSLIFVYIDFVIATVLNSSEKQKKLSVVAIFAAVLNIALNYLMIPYFQKAYGNGAIGAAVTTLVTEAAVMAMSFYLLPKGCFSKANFVVGGKSIASGVIMALTIVLVDAQTGQWLLSVILGIAAYVLVSASIRVLTREDVNFFVRLIPSSKVVAKPNFGEERST